MGADEFVAPAIPQEPGSQRLSNSDFRWNKNLLIKIYFIFKVPFAKTIISVF